MTTFDILRARLVNQQIGSTDFRTPHDLVAWLGAVQAQDYAGAKWSLGLRLPHVRDADIEQAINNGSIVRTWPMRGTLHFVAAEDVRWMLKLMAPRAIARAAGVYRQAGLTDAALAGAFALLEGALQGGKQLTRPQVLDLWERAGIATNNQRGYLMLSRAAQEGRICLGPVHGKQQTFVLLEEWVPQTREWTRDEALAEVARRYFTGHGPATLDDSSWWTGLTRTDTKHALAMVEHQLTHAEVAGQDYWYVLPSPEQPELSNEEPIKTGIWLLPGFDEYMLGYTDRSLALDDVHRQHVATKNAVYPGTIIIDGHVRGTWKRTIKKTNVLIELTLFMQLGPEEESEVRRACEAYGRFLEASVAATLGYVQSSPPNA